MNRQIQICGFLTLLVALSAAASDWPQWGGPHRNGVSQETGLLKEWPKEGPKLRWRVTDLGSGYSTPDQPKHTIPGEKSWAYPVVANGNLYIRDHGTLWCYDVRAAR